MFLAKSKYRAVFTCSDVILGALIPLHFEVGSVMMCIYMQPDWPNPDSQIKLHCLAQRVEL